MPPLYTSLSAKKKHALDFGRFLCQIFQKYMEDDNDAAICDKLNSINRRINYISDIEVLGVPSSEDQESLDSIGTQLWNMCTRLIRKDWGKREHLLVFSSARAFSFLMIDLGTGKGARGADSEEFTDDMRLLKVALTTAQGCLDIDQLDLCLRVLEKAASREEALSRRNQRSVTPVESVPKYSTEYYILRVALSWRRNQIDVMEHMFSKLDAAYLNHSPTIAERLAVVLYDIGKSMLSQGKHEWASLWLERSYDALNQHEIGQLGQHATELRLAVLLGRVRANLSLQHEDGEAVVASLLHILEQEYGNRLSVIILNLVVISKEASPDSQRYYEKLSLLTRTAPATASNFKMITRHIHRLNKWNSEMASNAMENLLLPRLILYNDVPLLERYFVTYVWMQTALEGFTNGLDSLLSAAEKLSASLRKSLTEEAAQASLILLWKKCNIVFEQKEYDVVEKWCLLAQHAIFENAGESNKSKIRRRIILCALEKRDAARARQILHQMSEASRSDGLTQYLMYRIALLDNNAELARECLEILSKQDAGAENYILACVAESRHFDDKSQEFMALQVLLDMLDKKSIVGIHLPELLRCTIRLLIAELDADRPQKPEVIESICRVFEISFAMAIRSRIQGNGSPFSVIELEWFSRNSYNLAVQYCAKWDTHLLLSLVDTSIKFLDMYPLDLNPKQRNGITMRRLFCHFLGAILSIAQARTEADTTVQRDYYLDSRNHIQSFRGILGAETTDWEGKHRDNFLKRHRTLLAFDFEAAARLHQWESLDEIISESEHYADNMLYGTFSDALLCSDTPIENATRVLQQITTHIIRRNQAHDTSKLSRWIRCHFQLALDSNVEMAESVLDQAYALARESQGRYRHGEQRQQQGSSNSLSCYPEDELEWLSTTAFNRAVDFYMKPDDASCRRWAQKALDLAGLMHDGGLLYKVLREKLEGLKWD
ncbi:uncharacterized protein PADG_07044 [Paracoccidioides brasiliensis Pb18]|uniref:Protein ZIP4 homolog n=1 Tax=Paracoccidioides brasiliensis (strain Pb18) TaxID=502780 RepID=C1GIF8_PARBD|nr:uncharacterized protein PADG_07044 [Paracoccidioides brasiliensis Pb18]EEH42224.2 hypothetical protein PADG_07044 [Paracoccidioides brasiliensis Pb18]